MDLIELNTTGPRYLAQRFMEEQHMLGWNIPPEHGELVHIHWRNYHAPENTWHFIMAAVYFCLMLLSTSGNGIVIYLFMTTKSLKTPSNLFIFNQALLDLCMMINMPMLVLNSFHQRIVGWELGCDIYGLFGSIAGFGSAMNNAVIAYDRYRTIAFPIDGRLSMGKAFILMCFVWAWALPFSLTPMKSIDLWGKYVPEGFLTTCSFDYLTDDDTTRSFVATIFVWAYVIPLLLIVFFYIQLLGHVRGHERMLKEQAKKMNVKSLVSNQDKEKSAEIRIAKVAILIFCLFLISWTPYATIALTGCFGNRNVITPMLGMIPAVAAKIVSCIDPWIYAINHPRFRAELSKRCPCLISDEKSSMSDAQSTGTHATAATEESVS
uniref:Opsin, blue-sensitive n=2 Tax=Cacopsylla melanoneura TaxID=428564 RepID=A0A8D9EIQ1_9HEMI